MSGVPASYYRARYYDPGSGRFLTEDPLRFFTGDGNFYLYAAQNPIVLTDPYGLKCKCTYSQSTGHLKCVDGSGNTVMETNGYAGNGSGQSNPDTQGIPNVGPLPRGNYGMGPAQNSPNTGPLTIPLTCLKKGQPPRNASHGCIVTPGPEPRKKIADKCGPGSTLAVGP